MNVILKVTASALGFSIAMMHMKPQAVDPSAKYQIEPSPLLPVAFAGVVCLILPWVEAAEAIDSISVNRIARKSRTICEDFLLLIVPAPFLLDEGRLAWQTATLAGFKVRLNSL
jgi:hypothetical protein